jgi:hypothetical protein
MTTKQSLKSKLQKELAQLKQLADKQLHLYVSSRTMLYEGLAKVYLWWQEANKEKGLLEKLYKDNGIQYKKEIKADAEQFVPKNLLACLHLIEELMCTKNWKARITSNKRLFDAVDNMSKEEVLVA